MTPKPDSDLDTKHLYIGTNREKTRILFKIEQCVTSK